MGYTRVSVAALMALVAFTGLGFAALRTPSELWADTIFSLLLATLSAGLLAALLLPREDRAFWLGFTLFGWGYAVFCFGPWSRTEVAPHLITTELLAFDFNRTDPVRSGPDDANPSAAPTPLIFGSVSLRRTSSSPSSGASWLAPSSLVTRGEETGEQKNPAQPRDIETLKYERPVTLRVDQAAGRGTSCPGRRRPPRPTCGRPDRDDYP